MITNSSIGSYGRFGNMLFQLAALIGIARENDQQWALTEPLCNKEHRDRFGSSEDVDLWKHFVNPCPVNKGVLVNATKKFIEWGYHDVRLTHGDFDISGHFQSQKYFKYSMHEVRHYMKMKEESCFVGSHAANAVAIHIRRGDYDNHYHPHQQREYYYEAISRFDPDAKFVVFSDNIDAAIEMLGTADNVEYREGHDYLSDFALMKNCGHFICANSSFSLMAAILSENPDKKIICPKKWFGGPAEHLPTADLYPEGAIIL